MSIEAEASGMMENQTFTLAKRGAVLIVRASGKGAQKLCGFIAASVRKHNDDRVGLVPARRLTKEGQEEFSFTLTLDEWKAFRKEATAHGLLFSRLKMPDTSDKKVITFSYNNKLVDDILHRIGTGTVQMQDRSQDHVPDLQNVAGDAPQDYSADKRPSVWGQVLNILQRRNAEKGMQDVAATVAQNLGRPHAPRGR